MVHVRTSDQGVAIRVARLDIIVVGNPFHPVQSLRRMVE